MIHTLTRYSGLFDAVWVEEYEYWFDWSTLVANTIAGTTIVRENRSGGFTNLSLPESFVKNVTDDVVSNAGATDAYSTLQMQSPHS